MLRLIAIIYFISFPLVSFCQSATGPQFNFINNDRVHDFGGVEINTTSSYIVQFKNTGTEPIVITDLHPSANETGSPKRIVQVRGPQKPVKPGKKAIITVTLSTKDAIGSFSNDIYVTSNASPANYPLLRLTGAIVPEARNLKPKDKDPEIPIEFLAPIIMSVAQ